MDDVDVEDVQGKHQVCFLNLSKLLKIQIGEASELDL